MFCTKCGNKIENNARFCPNCGNETSPANQSEVSSSQREYKGLEYLKSKWILLGLALVLILGVAFTMFGGSPIEKTVNSYFKAIQDADADKLISLMSDEYIEYEVNYYGSILEYKLALIDELRTLSTNVGWEYGKSWSKDLKIEIIMETDSLALVSVTLPDSRLTQINLIKVNGKWKIHEVSGTLDGAYDI